MPLDNTVALQTIEEVADVSPHHVWRDAEFSTDLFGDLEKRRSLVQQIEDSRAKRVHAEHRSPAKIQNDASVGARYSSDVVGKRLHNPAFGKEPFCCMWQPAIRLFRKPLITEFVRERSGGLRSQLGTLRKSTVSAEAVLFECSTSRLFGGANMKF